MRVVELFCGIGGFRYGLEKTNAEDSSCNKGGASQHSQCSFRCVYANDNDKYACQIYRKHWGDKELYEGDIRTVDPATIPEHDLICAGFPCQSFSIAGKRGGFQDTRGTLFFEIMRIARAKRTPYLLLENVKGLLSHDEGDTFQTILRTLDELGYDCQWQVLNSKDFGVPQNRERVFIIGHSRNKPRPKVFPIGETGEDDGEMEYQGEAAREVTSTLQARGQQDLNSSMILVNQHEKRTGEWGDGTKQMNEASFTLDSGCERDLTIANQSSIRRLTPIECERLQGFPEVEKCGIIEVCSDHRKNPVSVGNRNPKSQKLVGNVEKTESPVNVRFAAKSMDIKLLRTNKPVQPNVLISCEENGVEIHSQGKLLLNASGAEKKNWYHPLIKIEDFVQLLVGFNSMLENVTKHGEEELPLKEKCLIVRENGEKLVRLSGKEIMQPVGDAENDSTILKEFLRFTILDRLNTEISVQNLQTLSSFVIRAIIGYIPQEILTQNTFTVEINTKVGFTFGISDTQRYKTLGNAVTTNVIEAIGGAIAMLELK